MLRHEQLDRNFTYSTIRHSNRDVRGLKRNDSRNDLRHRHTIAGRIFLSNQAEANSEYANRLKERMEKIRPHPVTLHGEKKIFIFKELETSL